jgi:phage FluMu protein Com
MKCTKCDGLMVTARFSDFYQICYEWKCLNCGAIVFPQSYERAPEAAATSQPAKASAGNGRERRYAQGRANKTR